MGMILLLLVSPVGIPIMMHLTGRSTAVTALVVHATSSSSLQISWGPPEMINGRLTHYSLILTSESDGSQQTRTVQYDQLTEVNITDLGEIL